MYSCMEDQGLICLFLFLFLMVFWIIIFDEWKEMFVLFELSD